MYKTIVVHVDDSASMESRLQAAAALAVAHGARLVGVASTGLSLSAYARLAALPALPPADEFEALRQGAQASLARFAEGARGLGVAATGQRLIEEESGHALLLQSRYADLVVASQDGEEGAAPHGMPAYVALHGARPVLVVPPSWAGQPLDGQILVGWDGSLAATRAIDGALPLLCRAGKVRLALVNPDRESGLHGEEPGADMALFLARHGVQVEVLAERTALPVGEALLGMAHTCGAGLLVAGAFGHGRLREIVLGGVTRILLERAPLPVLLAH
ncbi:universal stress protein [Massilia jejuensis]|uniref:Universal stress protein n=1 Tax=Massilia jejuensis TaxID=648894 RepID=A0ABW0PIY0_9BURK